MKKLNFGYFVFLGEQISLREGIELRFSPFYITGWVDRDPTGSRILKPYFPINSGYPKT